MQSPGKVALSGRKKELLWWSVLLGHRIKIERYIASRTKVLYDHRNILVI